MNTLGLIVLVLHIGGFAAVLGGLLAQAREPERKITGVVRDGIGTAFVTGIILTGLLGSNAAHDKIGVKFAVTLVILVLVMVNMRKPRIPNGLYWALTALTVLNICLAVFWKAKHGY